jgi:hypothetical protein
MGSEGDDTLYAVNSDPSAGGAYAVFAGSGNDVIHVSGEFPTEYIDGGAGINTVQFDGANMTIDLSLAFEAANIQKLDLGEANNTLMLDVSQLLDRPTDAFTVTGTGNAMGSGTHQLIVDGDNGDNVQIDLTSGAGWHAGADWNYAGHTYHVYNNVDQHVQLMLEETLNRPAV